MARRSCSPQWRNAADATEFFKIPTNRVVELDAYRAVSVRYPAMPGPSIDNLKPLLAAGKDSALLRFSLGNAHLKAGDQRRRRNRVQRAVALDAVFGGLEISSAARSQRHSAARRR